MKFEDWKEVHENDSAEQLLNSLILEAVCEYYYGYVRRDDDRNREFNSREAAGHPERKAWLKEKILGMLEQKDGQSTSCGSSADKVLPDDTTYRKRRAGTMKKQLNLDTFNEILFGAFKEQTPKNKLELLRMELEFAMTAKIEAMEAVIRDLNEGKVAECHQDLTTVNNIDSNLDALGKQIDELIAEHPELKATSEETNGGQEE